MLSTRPPPAAGLGKTGSPGRTPPQESQQLTAALALTPKQLDTLPTALGEDIELASEQLRAYADRVAWLAAEAGGYEGLRPLLDIARRLRLIRDAIDPADTQACL